MLKKMQDPLSDSKPNPSKTTITDTEIISVIVNVGKFQSLMPGTQIHNPKVILSHWTISGGHQ